MGRHNGDDRTALAELVKQQINGCGYYQLLGLEIIELGNGHSRIRLPVASKLFQPMGMVHGGAVASIADAAGGVALLGLLDVDERSVTVELKINYIAPVREGELVAEGRVVHRGGSTAVVDVEVRNDGDRLVAKALGTFLIRRSGGAGLVADGQDGLVTDG